MRIDWLILVPLTAALAASGCDCSGDRRPAAPPRPAATKMMDSLQAVQVWIDGPVGTLQAFLWRPPGDARFPAIVFNHGPERSPIAGTGSGPGPYFAQHGYVVLFPNRRGAGHSAGAFLDERVARAPAKEQARALVDGLVTDSGDVAAAIEWLKAQTFVDPQSLSVAGCDTGGVEALLVAEQPLGIRAAVDIGGGASSWAGNPALRDRLLQAAQGARAPVLFLQTRSDVDTAPSTRLAEAMEARHLPHRVQFYPPYGASPEEAPAKFCLHGAPVWGKDVLEFLKAPR